jgi:hypothetical protein
MVVLNCILSASSRTYRNIPNISTSSPIPLAIPAEVPRLANIVIVEVSELCFHAIAARAWYYHIRLLQYILLARSIRFGLNLRLGISSHFPAMSADSLQTILLSIVGTERCCVNI